MRKIAFSLAEVLIAATLVGVLMALTLPSMTKGLIIKERTTAYKNAYAKVSEVAASEAMELDNKKYDPSEETGQKFWMALNNALSVVGYYSNNAGKEIVPDSKLKGGAYWTDQKSYVGAKSLKDAIDDADKVASHNNGWSPWIVTGNKMAFTVNAWSSDKKNIGLTKTECENIAGINQIKEPDSRLDFANTIRDYSCMAVLVDVNGLDKGPNTTTAKGNVIPESEMNNYIENYDRFYIFIAEDGATYGPEGLVEHWIMKK